MKILFVNTINVSRQANDEFFHPALSMLYIASYLRVHGGYSKFKVLMANKIDEETFKSINPDIVGVTAVTQNFGIAKDICHQIKQYSDVPVIMGGVHISTLPSCLTKDMDIGVIGEGEETMLELMNRLETRDITTLDLSSIQGIIYHKNGGIEATPRRRLIDPMDKIENGKFVSGIPYPDRSLVKIEPFHEHALLTSRGCPYNCSFCSPYAMWKSMRYFSPEYVVGEIDEIYNTYKHGFIGIADDLFTVNKKRLRTIAELAKKADFYGNIRIVCSGRANLIDQETVKLCKSIGVSIIQMGLESGCQRTLDYLKCKSVTVEQNKKAIDTIANEGLEAVASFIIGSPDETREEMLETLRFIRNSRLSYFQINALIPFPGTQVWEEAKKMGAVSDDMDWSKFAYGLDEAPEDRVIVSKIPRKELLQILKLFLEEREHRMFRRQVKFGLTHPERIYGHFKNKYLFNRMKKSYSEKETTQK